MNCLCNLFEDNVWWVIVAIIILALLCNNGCGCGTPYNTPCNRCN
jgi:hypothetical protein